VHLKPVTWLHYIWSSLISLFRGHAGLRKERGVYTSLDGRLLNVGSRAADNVRISNWKTRVITRHADKTDWGRGDVRVWGNAYTVSLIGCHEDVAGRKTIRLDEIIHYRRRHIDWGILHSMIWYEIIFYPWILR